MRFDPPRPGDAGPSAEVPGAARPGDARRPRDREAPQAVAREPRDPAGDARWPGLVCPTCQAVVTADAGPAVCASGHKWEVRDGIPRFVPPAGSYADAFGLQWNTFRRTQLDSHTGTTISRDRARRCVGEEGWARLERAPAAQLLEVGCGAGRFTEVLLTTRAAVTSVDLSTAVDANAASFPQSARHRVLQADVLRLPFAPMQYDVVFCLGVVQHTPSPEQTIAKLYEQVRPGGLLVIDHYPYTVQAYLKTAPLFRAAFRQLSPETGMRWTRRVVDFFLPLHEAVRGRRVARSLLARVSPVVNYYDVLPLNDAQQREWAFLDTHDALTDYYKHLRTPAQIRRTLEGLGATDLWVAEGGNGVEARARRPE